MKYTHFLIVAFGIIIATLLVGSAAHAATILFPTGGGTGSSTLSGILIGNGTSPVRTLTIGSNLSLVGTTLSATGGGSGFSTTSTDYWLTQRDTGDLAEGSNLYWTLARGLSSFITNLAATTSVSSITTLPSLSLPYSQVTGGPSIFSYLFPANATSTKLTFSGGLLSTASTTIGDGTQAGGLTISGGATTTGSLTGPQFSDAAKYFYLSKPASDFNIMRFPGSTDQAVELQVNPSDVPNPYFRVARTDLARSFVDTLWEVANTGGVDQVVNAVGSSYNVWAKSGVNGTQEAAPRIRFRTDFMTNAAGGLVFGDGTGTGDANLYRSAADTLKTDDALSVGGALTVTGTSALNDNVTLASGKTLTVQASGASNDDKFLIIKNSGGSERMSLGYASTDVGLDINNRSGIALASFRESGNVGLGTTSPYAKLGVAGQVVADFFTATTSTASAFPYASTTALSAASICLTGDTCRTTWPSGSSFSYPFPSNATTTNITFSGGLTGTLTGNASTATKLATARSINGVAFDGSADITISAASSTLLSNANAWSALQTFSNASSTQFSAASQAFYIDSTGKVTAKDTTASYSGALSPLHNLAITIATTTAWTGTTTGAYSAKVVLPFAGTLRDVRCKTDAGTLELETKINATALAYYSVSSTQGLNTFSSSNTFSVGDVLTVNAGAPATSPTVLSCTYRATES